MKAFNFFHIVDQLLNGQIDLNHHFDICLNLVLPFEIIKGNKETWPYSLVFTEDVIRHAHNSSLS